jgi:hypothetical protein
MTQYGLTFPAMLDVMTYGNLSGWVQDDGAGSVQPAPDLSNAVHLFDLAQSPVTNFQAQWDANAVTHGGQR